MKLNTGISDVSSSERNKGDLNAWVINHLRLPKTSPFLYESFIHEFLLNNDNKKYNKWIAFYIGL